MSATQTADVLRISLDDIHPNPVALRAVDRENEQYQNLVNDVTRRGVIQPISVREKTDEATQEVYYELCDGLQRFSASKDAGKADILARVLSLDDAEVEETQIVANLIKVDTKPSEYTNQLRRMLQRNQTMTERDLAEKISQSVSFIRSRLSLSKLDDSILALVDSGDICLGNAYALAKLPQEEQHNWTDQAMTQAPAEFVAATTARAKEIKDAAREGRSADGPTFKAVPKARTLKVLMEEFENPAVGPELILENGVETLEEAFALAIAFAVSLDPGSVAEQEAKWNKTQSEKAEAKQKRDAARAERKRREAAEKAAEAREQSGIDDAELEAMIAQQEAEDAERRAAREAAKAEKEAAEGEGGDEEPKTEG